MDIEQTSN